jgi:hypothetical protein
MKKHILTLLLFSSVAFSQKKPQDYSIIKNIDDLKKICVDSDIIIAAQINTIAKLEKEKNDLISKKGDSISILKNIIKETNTVFLREIFDEKYIKNQNYFNDTDLAIDDNTQKFRNSDVIIKSVMVDEHDSSVKEKCKYALEFNKTYLKLFDIRKNVLSVKYDSIKVNEAIKDIKRLYPLDGNSKLEATKNRIQSHLENYLERTCELKKILEQLKKNPDQTPVFKQQYTKLESKEDYKDYPYLIQIIRKIKNSRNDYSNDDLQPCEDIKKPTIDSVKPEVVKESTPKKVDESKTGKQ